MRLPDPGMVAAQAELAALHQDAEEMAARAEWRAWRAPGQRMAAALYGPPKARLTMDEAIRRILLEMRLAGKPWAKNVPSSGKKGARRDARE